MQIGTLPPATYDTGTHNIAAASLPAGGRLFSASFDRTSFTDKNMLLTFRFEMSFDGGVSWPWLILESEIPGGEVLDKNGLAITTMKFSGGLPEPGNSNRRIRTVISVAKGSITTSGSITVT